MSGEIFSGRVRGMTASGAGVVLLPDGRACFVAGSWRGEVVRFKIFQFKKNYARARLLEVLEASPARVQRPVCPYHGFSENHCGGCAWMFVEYESQLQEKELRIAELLEKSKIQVDDKALHSIQSSTHRISYRTRAQFKTDGKKLGYVPFQGNGIIDVEDCVILSNSNNEKLKKLRAQLPEKKWKNSRSRPWSTLDVSEDQQEDYLLNKRSEFQQANRGQNTLMKKWVKEKVESIGPLENVLELFCGSGNFTEILASCRSADQNIFAFESSDSAIEKLKLKGLNGVHAVRGDLFKKSIKDDLSRVLDLEGIPFKTLAN